MKATSGRADDRAQEAVEGYAVYDAVFSGDEVREIREAFAGQPFARTRAGARHVLRHEPVHRIASDPRMLEIASRWLAGPAIPYKATLFDKTPDANWPVAWHQDTTLPLAEKVGVEGWGPWSEKEGVSYARAPASVMEGLIALRLQLDDCTAFNGPLRVLRRTHDRGILDDAELERCVQTTAPVDCVAGAGRVLAMRPLIIHSSARLQTDSPRRVLHIEYARSLELESGLRLRPA
jgi:hypothetical protein